MLLNAKIYFNCSYSPKGMLSQSPLDEEEMAQAISKAVTAIRRIPIKDG